jgi:hypothetical protein
VIAHIPIGVRDIDRSKGFYNAALEPLGYKCLTQAEEHAGRRAECSQLSNLAASRRTAQMTRTIGTTGAL